MSTQKGRFLACLGVGVLLALAVVYVSAGLQTGLAGRPSSPGNAASSGLTSMTKTSFGTSTLSSVFSLSNQTIRSDTERVAPSPSNSTPVLSTDQTIVQTTTSKTTAFLNSGLANVASVQPPSSVSRLLTQPIQSSVFALPVLAAFILGLMVYRISATRREAADEGKR
jgi:hypothetical protein